MLLCCVYLYIRPETFGTTLVDCLKCLLQIRLVSKQQLCGTCVTLCGAPSWLMMATHQSQVTCVN